MMTDPIADMLTRIRNAARVEKAYVDVPVSKVKRGVADVLKREGFIWDYEVVESPPADQLRVTLKYGTRGERVIQHVKRVSSPGCRVFRGVTDLKPVLNGLGISIVTTNKGVLSDREAREKNVGGEVLCEVW